MAGKKFLVLQGGRTKEAQAVQASTGAGDAGEIPALDSTGRLDASMMPVGVGADTSSIVASENIAAGSMINVWNDAGTPKVRNADATAAGKEAHGFVLSSIASGAAGLVYFDGRVTGLTGLTPGARMYLSAATPGGLTSTPPSAAGNVVQFIGNAHSDTEVSFGPSDGVILA